MRQNKPQFSLGTICATPAALQRLAAAGETAQPYLRRHVSRDWGTLDSEDKSANDEALLHGGRLFSAYVLGNGEKIWIITEHDRSSTPYFVPSVTDADLPH